MALLKEIGFFMINSEDVVGYAEVNIGRRTVIPKKFEMFFWCSVCVLRGMRQHEALRQGNAFALALALCTPRRPSEIGRHHWLYEIVMGFRYVQQPGRNDVGTRSEGLEFLKCIPK